MAGKTKPLIDTVRILLAAEPARLTPQREAVLHALLANPSKHQSADEVLVAARNLEPKIGLATVYRNLELFAKLGIARRLSTSEGQSRYEFNSERGEHYHHHVVCLGCGAIAEFNEDLLEVIEERVTETTGYKVTDHCLQFYGYCQACSKKQQEKE